MPRDLFGDVTDPSIKFGTRRWYSVPLSFVAHTAAVGVLIVVPLVATGALPMPHDGPLVIDLTPPPLPTPPSVRRVAPPQVNPNAAPVVAPDTIAPEPELPPAFEPATTDDGIAHLGTIEGAATIVAPPPPTKTEPVPQQRVHVGGKIQQPQRLTYVAPVYPEIARLSRVKGMVIIQAIIDTEGRVQEARVLRSDSPLLNDAALGAVRQWTYSPTLLNGVPVSVIMTVTVQFQM